MKFFILWITLFGAVWSFGQTDEVLMHPNRGQWDNRILYNVDLQNGHFYFDKEGYTILLRDFNHHDDYSGKTTENIKNYAFKIQYVGANPVTVFEENDSSYFYRSYFLGNDSSKWKSKIFSYRTIIRKQVYNGIDVITKGKNNGDFEIDYAVAPHADVHQIKLKYDGFDELLIEKDGSLKMTHPLGYVTESKPKAWTISSSGEKTEVSVHYQLIGNVVSFVFPDGYNSNESLLIDPILAFSTFTGSHSDNWGFTAAPDPQGNAFGGGIVFASNYPTTTGAIDNSFNGGTVDAVISKFSSNGSQLLYSTFVGGNSSETPHSIVSNPNGEIYVMGVTSSTNFPTTSNAYQKTFKGGSYFSANGITFSYGTDIFILKINAAGTNLLGSTLLGGIKNDGISLNDLNYNYGDQFRGDITLDDNGNVYVASTSYSSDFPTANSTVAYGGKQDAVAFKLNGNLSQLLWSTFVGGSEYDAAYSVQIADDGSIYIAGGSNSPNLIFPNGIKTNPYGYIDGFIAKFNSNYQIQKGTFVGTSQYDQIYFLQLDLNQNIYVFGQTLGQMTISPGKYGNANSGQFIKKFDNTFSTELWTTLIGSTQKKIDISPTAFLVSNCYDIYFAGWGGQVNSQHSLATQSSTYGLPTTSDAYQGTTNGSNFYIGVLDPDATGLKYGTFIGGVNSSANHVDGGTSRFDKSGKMYHAVCAACGGSPNGFTTTPGVYSPTNNSSNCNMAVFKFELSFIQTNVTNIDPVICFPNSVTFDNVTTNGDAYFWDFGDGTTSNILNPSHTYSSPGNYTVSFVVHDTQNCYSSDTIKFPIEVKQFSAHLVVPEDTICPNSTYQLQASGGSNYSWTPANLLDNPNSANPTVSNLQQTTTFTVSVTDNECGEMTLNATIHVFDDKMNITQDTTICSGNSVPLTAQGATSYTWTPSTFLNNASIANPISTPTSTTNYTVKGISSNGCPLEGTVKITVIHNPTPIMPDSLVVCAGTSKTITVSGGNSYSWSPNTEINTTSGNTVIIQPTSDRYYYCDFTNACSTIRDSVFVHVVHVDVHAWNDTIICIGETVDLHASGALTYSWSPSGTPLNANAATIHVTPQVTTIYTVTGTDANGCQDADQVIVTLYPTPFVQTYPDIYAVVGDVVHLGIETDYPGTYSWSPPDFLNCTECTAPSGSPNKAMEYIVTYTDLNGCVAKDTIHIFYEPLLWIPNAFTPDGNQFNSYFRFYGVNVDKVVMDIFDRWGELIYTIHGFSDFWDGTYKGLACPIGTYVWKVRYVDIVNDMLLTKTGHVNLLR